MPPGKTKTPQESMSVSDDCLESNSLYGIISSSDKGDNIYMDMDGEALKEINMCTKTSADSPRDPPDHSMRSASESEDSGDSYNEEENESNEDSGSDNGMSQGDNDDSDEGDGDDGDNQGIQDRFFQYLKVWVSFSVHFAIEELLLVQISPISRQRKTQEFTKPNLQLFLVF